MKITELPAHEFPAGEYPVDLLPQDLRALSQSAAFLLKLLETLSLQGDMRMEGLAKELAEGYTDYTTRFEALRSEMTAAYFVMFGQPKDLTVNLLDRRHVSYHAHLCYRIGQVVDCIEIYTESKQLTPESLAKIQSRSLPSTIAGALRRGLALEAEMAMVRRRRRDNAHRAWEHLAHPEPDDFVRRTVRRANLRKRTFRLPPPVEDSELLPPRDQKWSWNYRGIGLIAFHLADAMEAHIGKRDKHTAAKEIKPSMELLSGILDLRDSLHPMFGLIDEAVRIALQDMNRDLLSIQQAVTLLCSFCASSVPEIDTVPLRKIHAGGVSPEVIAEARPVLTHTVAFVSVLRDRAKAAMHATAVTREGHLADVAQKGETPSGSGDTHARGPGPFLPEEISEGEEHFDDEDDHEIPDADKKAADNVNDRMLRVTVDHTSRTARYGDTPLEINGGAHFAALALLVEHPGELVTYTTLLRAIKPNVDAAPSVTYDIQGAPPEVKEATSAVRQALFAAGAPKGVLSCRRSNRDCGRPGGYILRKFDDTPTKTLRVLGSI